MLEDQFLFCFTIMQNALICSQSLKDKPYVVTNHALMKIFIMIMVVYTGGMINQTYTLTISQD